MEVYRTLEDVTVGSICKTSIYGWIVLVMEMAEENTVLCRILDDQTTGKIREDGEMTFDSHGFLIESRVGSETYWHINDLSVIKVSDELGPETIERLGL